MKSIALESAALTHIQYFRDDCLSLMYRRSSKKEIVKLLIADYSKTFPGICVIQSYDLFDKNKGS